MADSLGDLGWPVEDRILVLNVLRGLSDRYSYLRTWITRQRPFPTFLQVCDDLVMEELTQGLQPGSTSALGPSSSSSTPEIDLSSVFPTDPVVDPPLQLFPAGTAMPYPSPGRAPTRRSPVTPLALLLARASRGHLPGRPPHLSLARVPGRRLWHHQHASSREGEMSCGDGNIAGGPRDRRLPKVQKCERA